MAFHKTCLKGLIESSKIALSSSSVFFTPRNLRPIFSLYCKDFHSTCPTSGRGSSEMIVTVTPPCISDGKLLVNGKVVLTQVPSNVTVSPLGHGTASSSAAFFGAYTSVPSCRQVFSLGLLKFKIWWMQPWFGTLGRHVPVETQMLLLEATEESGLPQLSSPITSPKDIFYILLLPVLDGKFRATLQGAPLDELQFCIESRSTLVQTTGLSEAVFINSGTNPFELIKDSMKILESHKGTFTHIDHKKIPEHINWFGWCTWDAFYLEVNPLSIKEGLDSFQEGDCKPKVLIIDDGWQDFVNEANKEGEPLVPGGQFSCRLVDFKESTQFISSASRMGCSNLGEFIKFIKERYGLKIVYVWQALTGYWGGVDPLANRMKKYKAKITYPNQSSGNTGNVIDVAIENMEKFGIGMVDPEKVYEFFNDYHRYLVGCGIDGVKVDAQAVIETMASSHGGQVVLAQKYQDALETSVLKNFKGNNIICCMNHNTDCIYSSKKSAVTRASEDFLPREPTLQTIHIASVAYNSILLGEIFVTDWDMFQSNHGAADFHAAARAVGGCPVYVSDEPYSHDFKILKRLVLPDGSILRAQHAGRPTRDCLFVDPVMDKKSLLKTWNMNKLSGIIGVFNCQGAGYWHLKKESQCVPRRMDGPIQILNQISPLDIDLLAEVADQDWNGDCAIYAFHSRSLQRTPIGGRIDVSLNTLECEIFTVSPIRVFNEVIQYAPIGLIDMYNSGGAVQTVCSVPGSSELKLRTRVRGCGSFGAYSSKEPRCCIVEGSPEEFTYNADNDFFIVDIKGECNAKDIELIY